MKTKLSAELFSVLENRLEKLTKSGFLDKIKNAPRELCEDVDSELEKINRSKSQFIWKKDKNEHGFYLKCEFSFLSPHDSILSLHLLHLLQEKTNHHAKSTLLDFKILEIEVCTHQPKWGITYVDLEFAKALPIIFFD